MCLVGKIVTTGDRSTPGSIYIHKGAEAWLPGLVQPLPLPRYTKPFSVGRASDAGIGTTSMKQASELELEKIGGLSRGALVGSRALRAQVVVSW